VIQVRYLRTFDENMKALQPKDRQKAIRAISRLLDYFSEGPKPAGLGLRKLRGDYWEIRCSLEKRILFLLENNILTFIIAGSHDEIRRTIH
jgi:mRNA-degrading endonuclease RelE of RelBE toxin-antitoxin system